MSLILRADLGRKLTIEELDNNFIYLENTTGSAPEYFIPVGTGTGLTSSSQMSFNFNQRNLVIGSNNSIDYCSNESIVIGGFENRINNFDYGSGTVSLINSAIIGGGCNCVINNSYGSSVIGGDRNTIGYNSDLSSIIGGECNLITMGGDNSSVIGGKENTVAYSACSSIIGGCNNLINIYSCGSSIQVGYSFHNINKDEVDTKLIGEKNSKLIKFQKDNYTKKVEVPYIKVGVENNTNQWFLNLTREEMFQLGCDRDLTGSPSVGISYYLLGDYFDTLQYLRDQRLKELGI